MPGHGAWLLVPLSSCTHPDSTRWFLQRKMPQQRHVFHGQEDCTREKAGPQKTHKRKGRSPWQTPAQFRNSSNLHAPVQRELSGSPYLLLLLSAFHPRRGPKAGGTALAALLRPEGEVAHLERVSHWLLPSPTFSENTPYPSRWECRAPNAAASTRLPSCLSHSLAL